MRATGNHGRAGRLWAGQTSVEPLLGGCRQDRRTILEPTHRWHWQSWSDLSAPWNPTAADHGLLPGIQQVGWQLAEHASEMTRRDAATVDSARWDPDALRDGGRGDVVEQLGDPGGVLVVAATGFLKKGTKSAGVQRQDSAPPARSRTARSGWSWPTPAHRAGAGGPGAVPARGVGQRRRPPYRGACADQDRLCDQAAAGQQLPTRTLDAQMPARWVTADEGYGGDARLRAFLEEHDLA
jgi:hypothetical protein